MDDNHGGCSCGAIRYSVAGEPLSSSICHCVSCRRASGAQSVAWLTFPLKDFSLVAGEPVEHRSSERVVRTHCGVCGTSLTYRHEEDADAIDVTTESLDSPEELHHSWSEDGLPRFERGNITG